MGIRASSIEISNEEREYLELQTRARTMAQTVTRARILLLRADSVSIDAIADKGMQKHFSYEQHAQAMKAFYFLSGHCDLFCDLPNNNILQYFSIFLFIVYISY